MGRSGERVNIGIYASAPLRKARKQSQGQGVSWGGSRFKGVLDRRHFLRRDRGVKVVYQKGRKRKKPLKKSVLR